MDYIIFGVCSMIMFHPRDVVLMGSMVQMVLRGNTMTHMAIDADSEQWCQDLAFSATAVVVATEQAKEVVWQAHRMTIPRSYHRRHWGLLWFGPVLENMVNFMCR